MTIHGPLLEVSNVLLPQVLVVEPVDLSLTVKLAVLEVAFVVDSGGLLRELTTVNNNKTTNSKQQQSNKQKSNQHRVHNKTVDNKTSKQQHQ